MSRGKGGLVRTAGCHGELDTTDADGDERANFWQLAADGAATGIGQVGRLQRDAAQALEQNVGHRSKPQPQLVGLQGSGGRTVSEQVHLALFDAVLHFAAGAIDLFVETAAIAVGCRQRGDDEARIGLTFRPFRLGDDPPLSAPALAGRPDQFFEPARRLSGCLALLARLYTPILYRPSK